jgi:hypothetical protein
MAVYFEQRISSARGTDSVAADVMRHLHARQHLGKAIVLCDGNPVVMLSAARKQWLKLSRSIQKQRASTLNADKILKFTHTIARMQRMRFTMKHPLERPDADIYFLRPSQLDSIPANCFTFYLVQHVGTVNARKIAEGLPPDSLLVDYEHTVHWSHYGLVPKKQLEAQVTDQWHIMVNFLKQYDVHPKKLAQAKGTNIDAMDDALDTLLSIGHRFIQTANGFQRALELARPLRMSADLRSQYDTVILLAHRVQALASNTYSQRFLESYFEDDTFFLYDRVREYLLAYGETVAQAVARHRAAKRNALARALSNAAFLRTPEGPARPVLKWDAL